MNTPGNNQTDFGSDAADQVRATAQEGLERARNAVDLQSVAKDAREFVEPLKSYLQERPLGALGISLGVGVLLGILLGRR